MRCSCCNEQLTDYEVTLRHAFTKQFLELCQVCINNMDGAIPVMCRPDLMSEEDDHYEDLSYDDSVEDLNYQDLDDYWNER